jgi:hypothetical protein
MTLRLALSSLAAVAGLAACGAQTQPVMQSPPGTTSGAVRPEAKTGDLLYVSDQEKAHVYVYSYPAAKQVGTLSGIHFPESLCVDAAGNVYVPDDGASQVAEYAHGGTTPIKVLTDREFPDACAVDPLTGDLAVANQSGTVSIYPNATGSPAVYTTPFIPWFCAYDPSGNLFADGDGAGIQIAKLRKGGSAFERVTYHEGNNGTVAGMQWVGNHLSAGTASRYSGHCCGRIHRFTIKGLHGKRAGSMLVGGQMNNFFIEGSTAIVTTGLHRVLFYDYPKGGSAQRILDEPGSASYSVVVSHRGG